MRTFWYQIITEDCMQIDFDKIYELVKNNLESDASYDDIYWEFANNIEYYLRNELGYHDFYEDDNEFVSIEIADGFQKYLKDNFGYLKENAEYDRDR